MTSLLHFQKKMFAITNTFLYGVPVHIVSLEECYIFHFVTFVYTLKFDYRNALLFLKH